MMMKTTAELFVNVAREGKYDVACREMVEEKNFAIVCDKSAVIPLIIASTKKITTMLLGLKDPRELEKWEQIDRDFYHDMLNLQQDNRLNFDVVIW